MFRNISDSNTFGVIWVSRQTAVLHVNLKWYKIYFGGKINPMRPEPLWYLFISFNLMMEYHSRSAGNVIIIKCYIFSKYIFSKLWSLLHSEIILTQEIVNSYFKIMPCGSMTVELIYSLETIVSDNSGNNPMLNSFHICLIWFPDPFTYFHFLQFLLHDDYGACLR